MDDESVKIMGNILIHTLHFYNNFGSVLQAYALQKTLQMLSQEEVHILPYRPDLPVYEYFEDEFLKKHYEEKCGKFEQFRRKSLGMERGVDERLNNRSRLAHVMEKYKTIVVGSDIVWGREFSGLDPVYFAQMAPPDTNKIAYAAGIVLSEHGKTEDDGLFEKWMPAFDAVSVRETSSVAAVGRFFNKKVCSVLDPTLLLKKEMYDALAVENAEMKKEPYLLSYFLTHDPAVVDYTNLIAVKLGLRVIHYFADYPRRVFSKDAGCFAFAGPGEFLGYIKNAACIFTNSFHGTCFSLIYRKPFYTYMGKRPMLSRVRDMVTRLAMEERFFYDFRDIAGVTLQTDYTKMEVKLKCEREKSLDFLSTALKGQAYV